MSMLTSEKTQGDNYKPARSSRSRYWIFSVTSCRSSWRLWSVAVTSLAISGGTDCRNGLFFLRNTINRDAKSIQCNNRG